MSELLHIRAGDSDFSVTVGRSTAGFVYGTRSLPDDIDGIPAFIMDSTPLLVNQLEGRVEKDSSQVFTYGGSDRRDLLSRSEMIPKGQFSFTRSDLSVTRHEEDHEDGTTTRTTTKDFDVAGTIRRVTGDVHVSVELWQDSLGTIIPGVDVHVGDHVMLEVWGQTLELVVSSYRHSSTGWKMTVESVVQAPTLSKTNEMVQRWRTPSERIEQLSKEVRDIKDYQENDYVTSSEGGEPGPPGPPGDTPYINYQTGTWWIGDSDTYVQAQGPQGPPGPPGDGGGGGLEPPLIQSINSAGRSSGADLISQVSRTQETFDGKIYYVYRYNLTKSVKSGGIITITATIDNMLPGFSDTIVSYVKANNLNNYQSSMTSKYKLGNFLFSFNQGQLGFFIDKDLVDTNYSPTGRLSPTMNVSFLPTG